MSRLTDAVEKQLVGTPILAMAEHGGTALAVTPTELVTAERKLFGGVRITRYPRTAIEKVDFRPSTYANLLAITIGGEVVTVMYGKDDIPHFERVMTALKS